MGNNLVSWSSAKQKVVSRSSAESEYRGLSNAAAELVWVQSVLNELGFSPSSAPLLLCDNISATYLAANPVLHNRSKHIEIDQHFIREKVLRKQLLVRYVPSEDQLADILTKPLQTARFQNLRTKLSVLPRPVSLAGDDKVSLIILLFCGYFSSILVCFLLFSLVPLYGYTCPCIQLFMVYCWLSFHILIYTIFFFYLCFPIWY
ncbi:MAG: Ty1/Copia family ribonuclease HI, partial [Sweet potato little leaf phytoplasma]|nr:Ty1/Copia family ribonuclease HI [Sweet potato little leaf phytoplasma]